MIYLIMVNVVLWPFTVLGLLVIIQLKNQEPPIDDSNIFNRLRVFWFSLTRMRQMIDKFPWLAKDEWENMKDKQAP